MGSADVLLEQGGSACAHALLELKRFCEYMVFLRIIPFLSPGALVPVQLAGMSQMFRCSCE